MLVAGRCGIYPWKISDPIIHRQSAGEQPMSPCSPYSLLSSSQYRVLCQYCSAEISIYFLWSTIMYFWFFWSSMPNRTTKLGQWSAVQFPLGWIAWMLESVCLKCHSWWSPIRRAWALRFGSTPLSCHLVALGADHTQGPTRLAASLNRF